MNNKFLKSTLILIIGGLLTKIIGLIIKVIITRTISLEGVSLLSIINPTYSLLITIANFNILVSVSKRISSKTSSRKVLINSCYIMFFLNLLVMLLMFCTTKYIANNLLKNKEAYYPLIACTLSLPFISLGYIVKGYYYGKQNITPHMISNVLEQLLRLFLITTIISRVKIYGKVVTITTLLLLNILTESFSIIILLIFIPKNKEIKKTDLKFSPEETKSILSISVPTILGRIICNIGYFFEPIILTFTLKKSGSSLEYIAEQYGIYNAYTISTLLLPSFIITALSNALLPEISKHLSNKNYKVVKKRIKESLSYSLITGLVCTFIIYTNRNLILNILYKTNLGANYIKILSPFFILHYLESPLNSILTGLNKIKTCATTSITGMIIKLIIMTILGLMNFKIYSLIIAEIINILYVTTTNIFFIKKETKKFS